MIPFLYRRFLGGIIIIGPCSLVMAAYLILKKDPETAAGLSAAVFGGSHCAG